MVIALDCESDGVDYFHGARPFFVTICDDAGNQYWWEWAVDPIKREVKIPKGDLGEIVDIIKCADKVIAQNGKFDAQLLQLTIPGFGWPWHKTEDTLISGHLLASAMPHDLTSMAMQYLGEDIEPFEIAVKKATNECRAKVRSALTRQKRDEKKGWRSQTTNLFDDDSDSDDLAKWRIARKGDPQMPSAKAEPWKNDMWLPRAFAVRQGLAPDHPYRTVLRNYANTDSATTLRLWFEHEREINRRGLMKIYRERMKALPVISRTERNGVTLSHSRLEFVRNKCAKESFHLASKCLSIAEKKGYDLVLPKGSVNQSLTKFFFGKDGLGVPAVIRSEKTGAPSLNDEVLKTVAEQSHDDLAREFATALRAKRNRDTAGNTYLTGYKRFWLPNGHPDCYVLHPTLNPTGTVGLRLSCSNPNGQNLGAKSIGETGFSIRDAFGPGPGREWWAFDYENIELRLPAYESGEQEMIALFEKPNDPPYYGSQHLLYFDLLHPKEFAQYGAKVKEVFKSTLYHRTKCGDFAIQYGCQEKKADATYGVDGAYRMIKSRFRKLDNLNERCVAFANKHGYVETIPDKTVDPRHGFPVMCSRSEWGRISPTVPLNYHIQPSAGWCILKAMRRCQNNLLDVWNKQEPNADYKMIMQIHDELVFDFPYGGAKNLPKVKAIQKVMVRSGDDIGIPLRVAYNWHPKTYGKVEKIPNA